MRLVVAMLLYLVGFAGVVYGLWLAWPPLAVVAGSLGVLGAGFWLDPSGESQ